jgi:pimeloyl-ACP methyl ester carboxylesterase
MRTRLTLRRLLLATCACAKLLVGDAALGAEPPRHTFVIVPGGWTGGWFWSSFNRTLRNAGQDVFCPSLTGLGERVHLASRTIGLDTHIEDVVNLIRYEDLRNVVLVGHSYSGIVVAGVADRVSDRVSQVVYVDAFLPADGDSIVTLAKAMPDQAFLTRVVAAGEKDGFVPPFWQKPDAVPPRQDPQPYKTFTDRISLENPMALSLPSTFVLTVEAGAKPEADDFFPFATRARERGIPVRTLTADHNPHLSAPQGLLEVLLDVAAHPGAPAPRRPASPSP